MSALSPAFDAHIARKYSLGSLDQKVHNKSALQEELGWPKEPRRPLLCFPAGMTDDMGGALLKDVLPGILSLQVEILVLGKGSATYGTLFTELAKQQRHRVHIVAQTDADVSKMYAAADMAMFLSDTPMKELEHCLSYGVVPVAPHMPSLEDYDPIQERGNAFLFETPTKWLAFAALVRAVETHKFPFDWRTIQRHCMESVNARRA